MSLDYDIRKIPDEIKILNDHLSPITECIIFATIPTDIGEITEGNYKEFYMRWRLFNVAVQDLDKPLGVLPVDLNDIRQHIGLKTNVWTLTRRQWLTQRLSKFMSDPIHKGGI